MLVGFWFAVLIEEGLRFRTNSPRTVSTTLTGTSSRTRRREPHCGARPVRHHRDIEHFEAVDIDVLAVRAKQNDEEPIEQFCEDVLPPFCSPDADALDDILRRGRCVVQHVLGVAEREDVSVLHHGVARADDRVDLKPLRGGNEREHRVWRGNEVRVVHVYDREIGLLAGLQGAEVVLAADGAPRR